MRGGDCGWGWGAPALKGALSWLDVVRAGLLPPAAFPAAGSTPHTGSSGAQGLWSEFTAKPQLAAPKGSTGPEAVAAVAAVDQFIRHAESGFFGDDEEADCPFVWDGDC